MKIFPLRLRRAMPGVLFCLAAAWLPAQTGPTFFTCGNRRSDADLKNAAPARDGGLLAVGVSEAVSWEGLDGMLVKMDAAGHLVFRKTLGEEAGDDQALAVAEGPDGRIWVGGSTAHAGGHRAWLACRAPDGEPIFEQKLAATGGFCGVQELRVSADGSAVFGAGVRGGVPWFFQVEAASGKLVRESFFVETWAKTGLAAENATLETDGQNWLVFGSAKPRGEGKALFFLRFAAGTPENAALTTFTDQDLPALGIEKTTLETAARLAPGPDGHWLATGTARASLRKEQAFLLTIGPDLGKRGATMRVFGGRDFDEAAEAFVLDKNRTLVAGSTRSHKPGANTENIAIWEIKTGETEAKMLDFGSDLAERAVRLLRTADGSLWVCGSQSRGNALRANRNFAFAKIGNGFVPGAGGKIGAAENPGAFPSPEKVLRQSPGVFSGPISQGAATVLELVFENTSERTARGFFLQTTCPGGGPAGLHWASKIYVPETPAGGRQVVKIPVWTDKNAAPGDFKLLTELKNTATGPRSFARTETAGAVEPPKRPAFALLRAVNAASRRPGLVRGQNTLLEIALTNSGTAPARKTRLRFEVPEGAALSGRSVFPVENWRAGHENTFSLTVRTDENFPGKKLALRVFVDGEGFDGADFETEIEVAEAEKTSAPEPVAEPAAALPPGEKPSFIVEWQNAEPEEVTTFSSRFEVQVLVVGNVPVTLANIRLLVNDSVISFDGRKMDEVKLKAKNDPKKKFRYHLTLPSSVRPGKNRLAVRVQSGGTTEETPPLTVVYKAYDKGTLHVVSIGAPGGGLDFPQKDARDVAALFAQQRGKLYGEVETWLFTAPDSTEAEDMAEAVAQLLREAKRGRLTERDAVVFYISTHGFVSEEDGQYRLQGSNFKPGSEKFTTVSFEEDILKKLEPLPCHKFVLVDACHTRRRPPAGKKGSGGDEDTWADALNALAGSARSVRTLTSCSAGESSWEDPAWQNGAFTRGLKDLLGDPATCRSLDKNGDRALSIGEFFPQLRRHVQEAVKRVKGAEQTPFVPDSVLKEERGVPFWAF